MMVNELQPHPELRNLRNHLRSIHDSISHFQPPVKRPPILDSSLEVIQNPAEDTHWFQHDNIPGLKRLKDSIKVDLDALDKFLDQPDSAHLPPLSTNAPYLIAVWNEVLCAKAPVLCVFKSFSTSSDESGDKQSSNGAKIDVVADCGRRWIRVNTIKNSRICAEFREIDSYLTDDESSDEEDENYRPSLAQKEFDNSVLRMGRSLVAAARMNPVQIPVSHFSFENVTPKITLRLTRLDPDADPTEPRIAQTIQGLIDMGIDVQLGERTPDEIPPVQPSTAPNVSSLTFEPTTRINLDLSVLIALVSDLTHSPLPATIDEANTRFVPPERYLEWKKKVNALKAQSKKLLDPDFDDENFEISLPAQQDMAKTSRALTNQVLQEMGKGVLQEIADRINALPPDVSIGVRKIEFWTTREARDRCMRIVSKVGGSKEKRRTQGLLFDSSTHDGKQRSDAVSSDVASDYPLPFPTTVEKAQEAYWESSRYAHGLIPFIPLHFFPEFTPSTTSLSPSIGDTDSTSGLDTSQFLPNPQSIPPFFKSLHSTCCDILMYEKHNRSNGGPRGLKGHIGLQVPRHHPNNSESQTHSASPLDPSVNGDELETDLLHNTISSFPRATITKANPRLTAHTVQSLAWGSALGWTTLTANRTSVKAIVKEINARAKVEMFEAFTSTNGSVATAGSNEESPHVSNGQADASVSVAASLKSSDHGASSSEEQKGSAESSNSLKAAIWIIDPRSLAEGMRTESVDDQ
ncbi:hypothetical protein FB446DRAFT_352663 [Lentinula raphanica]|nr:hypothetical protein FB446DRAFT_352663 [Lentinula raphanica]